MRTKYLLQIIQLIILISLIAGCSETGVNSPNYIGEKPDPVTEYTVESINGGALINFKIPNTDDLLYVKAEYELAFGLKRETKSSLYKNYLKVDGFPKEGEYEIKLYAVSRGEVYSEPTIVKINVLTPPYLMTRKTLNIVETFGGVNVSFENENEADLSIVLLEKGEKDEWIDKHTYYSNSGKANFSVRGYESKEKEFAAYVKDRWGNASDTLIKSCVPIYEEVIPKDTWKKFKLPGDETEKHPTYGDWLFEKMWDGKLGENDMFHPAAVLQSWPAFFTIDLGVTAKFSRMKFWQQYKTAYSANNVKAFEVHGTNAPAADGSWECWTKLGTFEIEKPSGGPLGVVTEEDKAVAEAGHDFEFPVSAPAYRYIRLRILSSFSGVSNFSVTELGFWGRINK